MKEKPVLDKMFDVENSYGDKINAVYVACENYFAYSGGVVESAIRSHLEAERDGLIVDIFKENEDILTSCKNMR